MVMSYSTLSQRTRWNVMSPRTWSMFFSGIVSALNGAGGGRIDPDGDLARAQRSRHGREEDEGDDRPLAPRDLHDANRNRG
jgi:hypothetical protein